MKFFCTAKASHIFSTKNIGKFKILTFEILTKHYLTMSLVLNNRAQMNKSTGKKGLTFVYVFCGNGIQCRAWSISVEPGQLVPLEAV